jgi:hypothetical protein
MKLSGMTDRSEDVNKVFAIREAEIQRTYEPITIKRGKADISHLIPEPGSRESEKIHHLSLLTTVDSAIVENKTRSRPFIKWTFPRLFKMRNLNDKSSQEYKDEERRRRWMFWIGKMSNGDVSMSDGYIVDSKMELEKLRNGRITLEMGKTMLGESIVYKDEAETDTVGAQAPKHTLNDTAGLAGRSVQPHTEPQPQIENENRSVAVSTAAVPEDGPSQSETDLPRPNIDQSTHDDPGPPVSDEDRKRIEDDRAKRAENAKKGRRKR